MTESRLPPLAIILGVAGLIPFVLTGLWTIRDDATLGANSVSSMALICYGAVTLSFLGGVHWGFVVEGGKEPAERKRLALGVLPALMGWGAAVLGVMRHPLLGLAVLIFGFIATAVVEGRAVKFELVPRGYMIMRWGLTVVVAMVLTTVIGVSILG